MGNFLVVFCKLNIFIFLPSNYNDNYNDNLRQVEGGDVRRLRKFMWIHSKCSHQ